MILMMKYYELIIL